MADRPATTSKAKRKPGRKRRVAGWVLLVIGVLIAGVWGASRWWGWKINAQRSCVAGSSGLVAYSDFADLAPQPLGWTISPSGPTEKWNWLVTGSAQSVPPGFYEINLGVAAYSHYRITSASPVAGRIIFVAPWPFALASLLGGGWLVWSGRRARRRATSGMCRKCGYDLRGLLEVGAVCPECGDATAAA